MSFESQIRLRQLNKPEVSGYILDVTTGFLRSGQVNVSGTGILTGQFYPLLTNPSGYVTGNVVRPTDTGNLVDQTYLSSSQNTILTYISGNFYSLNNSSNFITRGTGDQLYLHFNSGNTGRFILDDSVNSNFSFDFNPNNWFFIRGTGLSEIGLYDINPYISGFKIISNNIILSGKSVLSDTGLFINVNPGAINTRLYLTDEINNFSPFGFNQNDQFFLSGIDQKAYIDLYDSKRNYLNPIISGFEVDATQLKINGTILQTGISIDDLINSSGILNDKIDSLSSDVQNLSLQVGQPTGKPITIYLNKNPQFYIDKKLSAFSTIQGVFDSVIASGSGLYKVVVGSGDFGAAIVTGIANTSPGNRYIFGEISFTNEFNSNLNSPNFGLVTKNCDGRIRFDDSIYCKITGVTGLISYDSDSTFPRDSRSPILALDTITGSINGFRLSTFLVGGPSNLDLNYCQIGPIILSGPKTTGLRFYQCEVTGGIAGIGGGVWRPDLFTIKDSVFQGTHVLAGPVTPGVGIPISFSGASLLTGNIKTIPSGWGGLGFDGYTLNLLINPSGGISKDLILTKTSGDSLYYSISNPSDFASKNYVASLYSPITDAVVKTQLSTSNNTLYLYDSIKNQNSFIFDSSLGNFKLISTGSKGYIDIYGTTNTGTPIISGFDLVGINKIDVQNLFLSGVPINTILSGGVSSGQTGSFYPLNSNPSGYITSSQTGGFIDNGDTGNFVTVNYVNGISGSLDSRIQSTGNTLIGLITASNAGVSTINGKSGILTFTGAGGLLISVSGQTFTFSGSATASGSSGSTLSGKLFQKSLYVENPTVSEDIEWFNKEAINLFSVVSIAKGNNSNLSWTLSQSFNRLSGDSLVISGYTDSTSTGNLTTNFANSTLSGDSIIVFKTQNISGTMSGFSLNIVGQPILLAVSGDFVSRSETGAFYARNNPSGFITTGQTGSFGSSINTGSLTGSFYPLSNNPSGYLTSNSVGGVRSLNITGFLNSGNISLTGIGNISLFSSGQIITISGSATSISTGNFIDTGMTGKFIDTGKTGSFITNNQTGSFIDSTATGRLTGQFYPLNSNPSGYLSSNQTGIFIDNGMTGRLVDQGMTGTVLVGKNQTGSLTGIFYPLNFNPSGYLTSNNTGNLLDNGMTGVLTGSFYPLKLNPSGYILPIQTGNFVDKGQTGNFVDSGMTGKNTGIFYPLNSNPSNYLTGFNSGLYVLNSNTGNFTTIGFVTGISGILDSRIQSTGSTLLTLIGASNAGVSSINSASGNLTFTGAGNILISKIGQQFTFSGDTGGYINFALKADTGNFLTSQTVGGIRTINITGATSSGNLILTGAGTTSLFLSGQTITISGSSNSINTGTFVDQGMTGAILIGRNQTGNFLDVGMTGKLTGQFYPLTNNPSSYIVASQTGIFIDAGMTGFFITSGYVNGISGVLDSRLQLTGNTLIGLINSSSAGISSINSKSGILTFTGTGGISILISGQQFIFSGLNQTGNFITTSQTGNFIDTGMTGLYTGVFYPKNLNPSGYITSNQTGAFVTTNQTGNLVDIGRTGSFATTGYVNSVSGIIDSRLQSTGTALLSLISASSAGVSSINVKSGSLTFTGAGNVIVSITGQQFTFSGDTGNYSNFVLNSNTGSFITSSQTGIFLTSANVGGVRSLNITGLLNSGNLILTGVGSIFLTQTGQTIILSGSATAINTGNFIDNGMTGAFLTVSQTGFLTGQFYPLNSNPSGYLLSNQTGSFITSSQTGNFIDKGQTGNFLTPISVGGIRTINISGLILSGNLILTGSNNLSLSSSGQTITINSNTGMFVDTGMTGLFTNKFYPLNSNPSGYILSSQTGLFIDNGMTGLFATTGFVTGVSGKIDLRLQSTGSALLTLIQASNAGVSSINSRSGTLTYTGAGNVSVLVNGQTFTISGDTGSYSNFIITSQTGNFIDAGMTGAILVGKSQTGNFITTSQTGVFYSVFGGQVSGAVSGQNIISNKYGFGAGIYTFSKIINGNTPSNIFSLTNQFGAQIMDVMVNCSVSGFSSAKSYSVAHAYGANPVFQLKISTGPTGSQDFSCDFYLTGAVSGIAMRINNNGVLSGNFITTLFLGGCPTNTILTEL